MTYRWVADLLEVSYTVVHGWAKKYRTEGLEFLVDKPRSGRPVEYYWEDRSKVTVLACSEPPKGYQRWSICLLADRLVALELVPNISPSGVQRILKKMNFRIFRWKIQKSSPLKSLSARRQSRRAALNLFILQSNQVQFINK